MGIGDGTGLDWDTYMQPRDGTPDVEQAAVQSVAVAEVDGRHAGAAAAVVAPVIRLDGAAPVLAGLLRAGLAEADVDQEVAEGQVGLEVWGRGGGRPRVDRACAGAHAVPAAEFARAFGFVVERGAERNDALDLSRREGG